VTWHDENDTVVLSLWHGSECVASAPMSIADAAGLATFLVDHIAARATARER